MRPSLLFVAALALCAATLVTAAPLDAVKLAAKHWWRSQEDCPADCIAVTLPTCDTADVPLEGARNRTVVALTVIATARHHLDAKGAAQGFAALTTFGKDIGVALAEKALACNEVGNLTPSADACYAAQHNGAQAALAVESAWRAFADAGTSGSNVDEASATLASVLEAAGHSEAVVVASCQLLDPNCNTCDFARTRREITLAATGQAESAVLASGGTTDAVVAYIAAANIYAIAAVAERAACACPPGCNASS